MELSTTDRTTPVDIGAVLDGGALSPLQVCVILLSAGSIIFDGLGIQLMGYAIPRMAREWAVSSKAFAPAVTAGIFGMATGSACAGIVADRLGRRRAVIACVLLFGLATVCVSLTHSVGGVAVFRLLAGIGIGGALPTSTTLVAEFTPARVRTLAVTCTIVCVPLGGMFAGFIAEVVHDWPALFVIGGGMPIALSVILFFALPESPKFLARYPTRWPELENLLLRMRRAILPGTQFTHVAEQQMTSNVRLSALINHEFRRDTFALWVAFLTCLFTIYMVFSWLPAMLVAAGFTPAQASLGLEIYNAGGVAGALACALVIARYGSRWPLIACCAGGSALALIAVDHVVASSFPKLIAAITIHGFFANAVQSILFALGAFVYPTPIRARGSAFAVAFGRCGAILAGSVGAFVISSNSARYFLLLASALFITMIALGVQRRHIPAQSSSR